MPRSLFAPCLLLLALTPLACRTQPLVETTPVEEASAPRSPQTEAETLETLVFATVGQSAQFTTWGLDLTAPRAAPEPLLVGLLATEISPDGERFLGIMQGDHGWAITERGSREVIPLPEGYTSPTFSEIEHLVAVRSSSSNGAERSEIRVIDLEHQSETTLVTVEGEIWDDIPLILTPDGSAVIFFQFREPRGSRSVDFDQARVLPFSPGAGCWWSPDGTRFLTIAREGSRSIELYGYDGGQPQHLRTVMEGPAVGGWIDDDHIIAQRALERGRGNIVLYDLASTEERLVAEGAFFDNISVHGWFALDSRGEERHLYYLGMTQGEGLTLNRVPLEGDPGDAVTLAGDLGVAGVILGFL